MVDGQSQTDPSFKSTRLYTRLSAAAVRQALITRKGYRDDELPSEETIRVKLNNLGYTLRSVKRVRPLSYGGWKTTSPARLNSLRSGSANSA